MQPTSIFLFLLGGFMLSACNGQPVNRRTVVITHDTVPIPGQWPLPTEEGQLCSWVRNMHQDRSGALWFGTNHFGIIRYANDTLEYLADSAGITSGRINAIIESADGTIWLATDGEGLHYRRPEASRSTKNLGFAQLTTRDGLLDDHIWSMCLGRNGTLWIGTMTGLCTYDGEGFETIELPPSTAVDSLVQLSPTRITSIVEDQQGRLWFGRDGDGLYVFAPKETGAARSFEHYTVQDGLPDNSVTGLMVDSKGRLWIGTNFSGVSLFDPSAVAEKGTKAFNNLTKEGVIEGIEAGAFHEDRSGHIWFAAEHHGVYRYDGTSFTNYGPEDGLTSGGILSMMEDREGRFWFGGFGGLFRFDRKNSRFMPVGKTGPWGVL